MEGFFTSDVGLKKAPLPLIARCGTCGLYRDCKSPKMPPSGKGKKRILLVAEAPGRQEDNNGIQFFGEAGTHLKDVLVKVGIDMREDCFLTNAATCRPPNNKLPKRSVDYCRPNLIRAVEELQPEVIIPLGESAVRSLLGWLWKGDSGTAIGRWVGWQIPCQKLNCWICPTWHPSYLLRNEERATSVLDALFERHLRDACSLQGRPWQEVPNYARQVNVIVDVERAAEAVYRLADGSKPVAIDYETNMLKPDSDRACIVSCAVSDGETTVSYPWHGKAIKATKRLLRSKVPKIASNCKFEERWTRREFGHGVRNWCFDTMLAAHAIDSRPNTKSIKFQAWILLGQGVWNAHIEPFLQGKGKNEENRIKEISLDRLLLYGGMDALLEWQVAQVQARKLGVNL